MYSFFFVVGVTDFFMFWSWSLVVWVKICDHQIGRDHSFVSITLWFLHWDWTQLMEISAGTLSVETIVLFSLALYLILMIQHQKRLSLEAIFLRKDGFLLVHRLQVEKSRFWGSLANRLVIVIQDLFSFVSSKPLLPGFSWTLCFVFAFFSEISNAWFACHSNYFLGSTARHPTQTEAETLKIYTSA